MNKKTNKNYGIEALRIFSMFFIVVHHVLGHGGALGEDFRMVGYSWFSNTFLESIVICAVNCYAMISGYVGYREGKDNTEKRITKYILMWLQVVCYNFGIALLFYLLKPSSK